MTKPLYFIGSALDDLRAFPRASRPEAGSDWKPMTIVGHGVREIRIHQEGQYRVVYVAKINDAVHVLHAFQKKTQKTRKQDVEIARRRLEEIIRK